MERRHFLASAALLGPAAGAGGADPVPANPPTPADDRSTWLEALTKVADPVLNALSRGELKKRMPLAAGTDRGRHDRFSHLEALGRLICGVAPWLELGDDDTPEGRRRSHYLDLTHRGIAAAVDPVSPDYMTFTVAGKGDQPLVDASLLGYALLRAPRQLKDKLSDQTRGHLVTALRATRSLRPANNNHLLFSAMVEVALLELGTDWDETPVDKALTAFAGWYRGDGWYSDGPEFHFDYYNSFIIHPYLLDILAALRRHDKPAGAGYDRALKRAQRFAECLERLISPEGTIPPIGRSLANRFSIFHILSMLAWQRLLPASLPPAQVRCGLTAALGRMFGPPGTFDEAGWLRVGLAGHQPGLGETYMTTGSLYGCALGFLPLGLPPGHPFWAGAAQDWTAKKVWAGIDVKADKALPGLGP